MRCATPDMVVRYVHKAPGIAFDVQELATKPLTLILPGASGVAANLIGGVVPFFLFIRGFSDFIWERAHKV